MSRSAWPLIYLRVVCVIWLVRLQVYPVQSDVKAPARELVSCRTSSLTRLFVLLFKETSMFCICMSFCWCFSFLFFTLHCDNSFFFFLKKRGLCNFFLHLFFKENPHELPSQIFFSSFWCSLSVFRGLVWRTKVK